MTSQRAVLLVTHTGRADARTLAGGVVEALVAAGLQVRTPADEAEALGSPALVPIDPADPAAADGCEIAVVLGGDGTILRACELVRGHQVPVLGVNLGHVGFLAEVDREDLVTVVEAVVQRRWSVERRLVLDVVVRRDGSEVARTWALNEASVEKAASERMLELVVEIDRRPLSRWGADGVIVATPTGSTAYAFSAGGPVVWPEVEALVVVPISAHALFARPVVVSPDGVVAVEVVPGSAAVMWCDGRRTVELPAGSRVEVRRSGEAVLLARLHPTAFTDRLVAKFGLPVNGWRGTGQ